MPTSALEAFGGLTGRLIGLGLIHSLWIGLLIAAGVALIFQMAPQMTHRVRHATLIVAMLVAATGPIAMATAQHLTCTRLERREAPLIGAVLVSRAEEVRDGPSGPSDAPPRPAEPHAGRRSPRFPVAAGIIARAVVGMRMARPVITPVWSAIVASLCAVLALGGLGLRRLCRAARSAPIPIQNRALRLARLLRLRRIPRILIYPGLTEPFLCGLLRPTIVLPRAWVAGAPPAWLDAVLAHELAHAHRRDPLVNLAQRLVEVGLFFHPAVRWLSRSLRRERELCADALAVRLTGDRLALAEALQSVARLRLTSPRVPAVGASLGGPSVSLLPRIQELIGMTPSRPRFTLWPLAALPAAGFLALIATAAGLAEERPGPADGPPQVKAGEDRWPVGRPADPKGGPLAIPTGPVEVSFSDVFASGAGTAVADDRQISFEVRYITGLASSWRFHLLDRLRIVKQEADVAAWTLDDRALHDLLAQAQAQPRTSVLQAPKVTTFNRDRATIIKRDKRRYIAGFDKVESAAVPFRPIMKEFEVGFKLDMTGTIEPSRTRLSVDLSDSWLLALRTMVCEQRVGPELVAAEYMVPTLVDRKCQVACEIPEGTHLLISLGFYEKPGDPKGVAAVASELIASVGLPTIQPAPATYERLVLITTRPIILESEEEPIRPAGGTKAASESK